MVTAAALLTVGDAAEATAADAARVDACAIDAAVADAASVAFVALKFSGKAVVDVIQFAWQLKRRMHGVPIEFTGTATASTERGCFLTIPKLIQHFERSATNLHSSQSKYH